MSQIILNEIATPSTPAAGKVKVYAKTGGGVYKKGSDGVETSLGIPIGTWPESPHFYNTGLAIAKFPTWINQGAAAFTDAAGGDGVVMRQAMDTNNYLRTRYKALVNQTNYRITFQVWPTTWGQYNRVGITLMNSTEADPTKAVFFGYMQRDDSPFLSVHRYTSHTVFDGVYYELQMRPPVTVPLWWRLWDDDTNWNWQFSTDGCTFLTIGTTARNDWFSAPADRVGISIVGECSVGLDVIGWYRSWKEEHYESGAWHTEAI